MGDLATQARAPGAVNLARAARGRRNGHLVRTEHRARRHAALRKAADPAPMRDTISCAARREQRPRHFSRALALPSRSAA